jgi:hypothetical protein
MTAKILAEASASPYVILCGSELLALGVDAARYLATVLDNSIKLYQDIGLSVVLDEADGIIRNRSIGLFENRNSLYYENSANECLQVLLNRTRDVSINVNFIITTTLSVELLDAAFRDRYVILIFVFWINLCPNHLELIILFICHCLAPL